MPASLLVVARAVQIGASLLLAGIFTFEFIVLGPASRRAGDDWHRFDRRLFRPRILESRHSASLRSALVRF